MSFSAGLLRLLAAWLRPGPAPTPPRAEAAPDISVTSALLRALGTGDPEGWAAALAPACARFEINTKPRLAMFLANVIHETGGFRTLTENLNYSVSALLTTFGRHRISTEDALRLGRKPGQGALNAAQQAALADVLYGGEWGRKNLGNTQPGDGARFRGYGLIQATGRGMWDKLRAAFALPDLDSVRAWLLTKEGAALSAAWIWAVEKQCNACADVGDMAGARRRVNGGTIGLEEVTARYREVLRALG